MNMNPEFFFERLSDCPFITPASGTLAPDAVTTPDVLLEGDQYHLYVGAVSDGVEGIIRFSLPNESLLLTSSFAVPEKARLILSPGPYEYNCFHAFDPAVIYWKGEYYLYYSAVGKGSDTIGLAKSVDGFDFKKNQEPTCVGRSPEIVCFDDKLYLFYVNRSKENGYRIYIAQSSDGENFTQIGEKPIIDVGLSGEWDMYEVTTPRVFYRNGYYYLVYAASRTEERIDLPEAFGLARSSDLISWEKYPNNPVFRLGKSGNWDDGAIWFGSVFPLDDYLYLMYEGGRLIDLKSGSPGRTQVGLARISADLFDQITLSW
jgi:predicted GH43/DUF377 family glycosyl hydrolase